MYKKSSDQGFVSTVQAFTVHNNSIFDSPDIAYFQNLADITCLSIFSPCPAKGFTSTLTWLFRVAESHSTSPKMKHRIHNSETGRKIIWK